MKSKIYLILFALFAFSCSSDSSSDDGNNNNNGGNNNNNNNLENALLVSEILVDQGQSGSMNFNYDGNKLTYISRTSDIGDITLLTFIYTNNKISRIDRSFDTSQGIYSRWDFSYDNQNRLNYYEHCYLGNNNECDYLNTFSISYSSNNTVTQNYIYDGTDYIEEGTLTLQLDNNGNIISGTDTYIDNVSGSPQTISVSGSFQYDNQNSPFKNITGINALILQEIISSEYFYLLSFSASNNCVSQNYEDSDSDDSYSVTYAYDYNNDDYPRQIITYEGDGLNEQIFDISYY